MNMGQILYNLFYLLLGICIIWGFIGYPIYLAITHPEFLLYLLGYFIVIALLSWLFGVKWGDSGGPKSDDFNG